MLPKEPALVEVSLLYRDTPDLKNHLEAICETVEDHGSVVLEVIELGGESLAVLCDDLRVVLTDAAGPVSPDPLLSTARLASDMGADVEVLPSIDAITHSVKIVVLDPERAPICGPASDEVKRTIAWDLAHCLAEETDASLIHWAATDVLYTTDDLHRVTTESRASNAFGDGSRPAEPGSGIADPDEWIDVEAPRRRPVVLGDGPLPEAHPPSRLSAALEAARSVTGQAGSLLPLQRIRESLHLRRTLH